MTTLLWTGAAPVDAQGQGTKPAKPTGLQVSTQTGSLDVSVDWDDTPNSTSYLVRWREGVRGTQLNEGVSVTASAASVTVADYGSWVVKVSACNDDGCGGGKSTRFQVEPTPEPNRAPMSDEQADQYSSFVGTHNAPRGILVSKVFAGIFTDPDGDPLSYTVSVSDDRSQLVETIYVQEELERVFIRLDADGNWGEVAPRLPDPLVTTIVLTATDPEGLSASVSGDFQTYWDVPAKPDGLQVSTEPGSLDVSADWDDVDGATHYLVRWRVAAPDSKLNRGMEVSASRTDITLDEYGRWVVRVEACNDVGCGLSVAQTVAVLPDLPGQPSDLTAALNADLSSVVLTWTVPADGGSATGYQVLRRVADGTSSMSVLVDDTGNADTAYTDATATIDTAYIYRVKAVNAAGAGAVSGPAQIFFTDKPGRPSGLSATLDSLASYGDAGFSVSLSWDVPESGSSVNGYQILRREATPTSSLSVLVDDTGNANTTYRDTSVAAGQKYLYRVRARNAAGVGEASAPAQAAVNDYRITGTVNYDEIQAIDNPVLVEASHAGRYYAAERVVGVSINGDSRAYSIPYLSYHEVVNDTVGETPVAITYSPHCQTAIVFERTIEGVVHDFGASGALMDRANSEPDSPCLVMYDRQSESLWSQVLGLGVRGEHNGVNLRTMPATFTTWGEWKQLHPDTKALEKTYLVSPPPDNTSVSTANPEHDDRAAVAVAWVGNKRIAYPFNHIKDASVRNVEFNGVNLLVFYDTGSQTALVFDRKVGEQTLSFQYDSGSGADTVLVDRQTGSKWQAFSGVAAEGELQDRQLERIHAHPAFWLTWRNYYPDSQVYPKPQIAADPAPSVAPGARPYRGQLGEVLVELSLLRPAQQGAAGSADAARRGVEGQSSHTTSIVYVIDDSGSMDGDFPEVRTALKDVRDTAMADTKVALIGFGRDPNEIFGLTDHSTDPMTGPWTDARINSLGGKLGTTNYGKALIAAKTLLDGDTGSTVTTKKIIFLTDAQEPYPIITMMQIAGANIVVDTIAFGDHYLDSFTVLQKIAGDSGGNYRAVGKPSQGTLNDPKVTPRTLSDILKDSVADNTATLFLVDYSFSTIPPSNVGAFEGDFTEVDSALSAAETKAGSATSAQIGLAAFLGETTLTSTWPNTSNPNPESFPKYQVVNAIGSSNLNMASTTFGSTGSTDIDHALQQAYSTVSGETATNKRVALITDGISAVDVQDSTLNRYKNDNSVTLDVVALGPHADRVQLKSWADSASGAFSVARVEVKVSFKSTAYAVDESDDTNTPDLVENQAVITVTLNDPPGRAVTIPLTKTNQAGASSADYSGVPNSVTFSEDETSKIFTITATDDSVNDDWESVKLGFGATLPDGVTAGSSNETTVYIHDDD